MSKGPQKADHGGKFCIMPHRVIASAAWRHLSTRAQSALCVIMTRHTGFNNGYIGISIRELSLALGSQNFGGTSRAVAQLIAHGFLECTSQADRRNSKTREYRITFISTGKERAIEKATHEYLDWRPTNGVKRKFGAKESATKCVARDAEASIERKVSAAGSATTTTESWGLVGGGVDAETARHIGNHLPSSQSTSETVQFPTGRAARTFCGRSNEELRHWTIDVVESLGYGGQRQLSNDSGVPEAILSKFRNGRGLPARYRNSLQAACARVIGFKSWSETRTPVGAPDE